MQNNYNPANAADFLRKHDKIMALAHVGPDGDTFGSMAAIGYIAKALGKDIRLYCQSQPPEHLAWLTLPDKLYHSFSELGEWVPDLIVFVDCAVIHKTGQEAQDFLAGKRPKGWENTKTLAIDHHFGNAGFADLNWIEPTSGATAELVGLLAEHLGVELSGELGECIYLGLVSDTGNFTYSSATSSIMNMAARIVAQGLKVETFTEKSENNWSIGRMQLWGELIQNLKLYADGQVVSIIIKNDILKKYNCSASALEGFVSWLRHLKTAKVSLLVRDKKNSGSKASLRSMGGRGSIDVSQIAAKFGGGGHTSASGVEMAVKAEEAEEMLRAELIKAVEQQVG